MASPPTAPARTPEVEQQSTGARTLSAAQPGQTRGDSDLFTAGKDALTARDYSRVIASLREFLDRAPQDPRAPEARFLLAESYRADGRFADAVRAYTEFLERSPEDLRVPAATFGLAESRIALKDSAGCSALREALARYPAAPEAASATTILSTRCP